MNGETILVVDDNQEIVYSISELLKYEGYQVVKAYDGMEALNALEINNIDLILLDVMMPVMDGLEATRRIRALEHPDAGTVTILAMTAQSSADSIRQCEQAGMNGYIAKPVEAAELIKILSEKCPKGCKN